MDQLWKDISEKSDTIEYILPQRTSDEFWEEGKLQADIIAKEFIESDVIAEYGCGIGRILTHLNAKEKHGIDITEKYLNKIDDETIIKHLTNGLNLDSEIDENTFDFIYSLMVFQHIPKENHLPILKNILYILKSGGKLLIQFPQNPNEYYRQTKFVNLYDKEELEELFKSAGFDKMKIYESNLVKYGKNGSYVPTKNLEYFVEAYKS
jgi:SAM-dependent methyltransferase